MPRRLKIALAAVVAILAGYGYSRTADAATLSAAARHAPAIAARHAPAIAAASAQSRAQTH